MDEKFAETHEASITAICPALYENGINVAYLNRCSKTEVGSTKTVAEAVESQAIAATENVLIVERQCTTC